MKTYSLFILLLVLLFGSSCKKEYITITKPDVGKYETVIPSTSEQTATEAEIKVINDWKIVENYSANNGEIRMWKFKSGNKVVLVTKAPSDLFWKEEYQPGYNKTFPGEYILALLSGKNI